MGGCWSMSFRSDMQICENDTSANMFEMPAKVPKVSAKDNAAYGLAYYAENDNNANNYSSSDMWPYTPDSNCLLKKIMQEPLPNCREKLQFTTAFENSPALTVLCIFLGSFRELNRLVCVSRGCKSMFDDKGSAEIANRHYLYKRIAREVFQIPFQIDTQRSLQRWENYQVYWRSIRGSGTPYWLVRGADGNPVGRNLSRKVYAFGGSSVSGDSYSKTLYQLFWNADDSVIHKEVGCAVDNSFPSRAACGFVQTNNRMCYVFGGRCGTHYLDDLWSFKVREPIIWVPHVTQQACPAPRWAHAMIAIKEIGFLLYGGSAPGRLFGDLWYFNGVTWAELPQSEERPHDRAGHAVSIVTIGDIDWFYIYGGNTAGPVVETYSDLWRLPLRSNDQTCSVLGPWQRVDVTGPSLTPRIGHSLTLCGTRLVIFGGRNLSATSDQQFAAVMDIVDLDLSTGAARNTVVPVPADVRRTGHFVLSHPHGLVFAAGLSANRTISTTILCGMV